MDKEGNYLVVHGLSLSEIPEASDIKLVFNGHGNDKGLETTIAGRTYRMISVLRERTNLVRIWHCKFFPLL
jgi:hypothetical protein